MKTFVTDLLTKKLLPCYLYHNLEHTLYVLEQVKTIGEWESCNPKEIALLEAAALWHDTGFINTSTNHEKESCQLAIENLPAFGFSKEDITTICGMIMATKMPQSPHNKLEEIIADADLAYLGAPGVEEKATALCKELQCFNAGFTNQQWQKTQLSFLKAHQYFTSYGKEKLEPRKKDYLNSLLSGKA
ncbi:MAG: HD domain-containing protein [Chitinophagaceae bacterium]